MCKILSTVIAENLATGVEHPDYTEAMRNFKFITNEDQITDDVPMAVIFNGSDSKETQRLLNKCVEKGTWVALVTYGENADPSKYHWWDRQVTHRVQFVPGEPNVIDVWDVSYPGVSTKTISDAITEGYKHN